MIMNHEIYMGEILLETIKNELGEGNFIWYKDSMIRLANETYREKVYYLTEHYLIETRTNAKNFTIKKFSRDTIKNVEKDFSITGFKLNLEKVTLYFSDNEDDYLCLTRPNEREGGDIREYEKLAMQL